MYLSALVIHNFRQFGDGQQGLMMRFNKGVTALVGENDAGKSSVIDALRLVLQTRDGEFVRLQPDDFHIPKDGPQAHQIKIVAKFSDLSIADQGALSEYITFNDQEAVVYVHWSARRLNDEPAARRWVDIAVRSGHSGGGPSLDVNVRQLLAAAYLRPLRDAEREMSPGRGSRLSQVLKNFPDIKHGVDFDAAQHLADLDPATLSLAGLAEYLRHLVNLHGGVRKAQSTINENYLSHLGLEGDDLHSRINFVEGGSESSRLRQILERLELGLLDQQSGDAQGTYGLGSNNLLFMACELLLLGREPDGLPLLLIEEPEAHLHPQRQLRLMEFLEAAAKPIAHKLEESEPEEATQQRPVQVILTTHSPNLSSKIALNNLVLMHRHKAYSLAEQQTNLDATDYRFLARFLDVTKANLFFARGVVIVEGDGEAILLPALAKIMGRDFTRHGVSVVNVGGTGLGRYSRILQRAKPEEGMLHIPVARIADMDVMPDCAPAILGLVDDDNDPKWYGKHRRWKAMRHFGDNEKTRDEALAARRAMLKSDDAQNVQTFVATHWTLEYDLAYAGLAKQLLVAARLAANDDALNLERKQANEVVQAAEAEFEQLRHSTDSHAHLCSHIYSLFTSKTASKAITAQYLVEVLGDCLQRQVLSCEQIVDWLPGYLTEAIIYATTHLELAQEPAGDAS